MVNKIIIYCDGACRNNQAANNYGGWGVFIQYGERTKELYGGAEGTTNNKMELTATIEAMRALKPTNKPIEIRLDSNYVLQGITSWIHGWKRNGWRTAAKKPVENKELWMELDELQSKFSNLTFTKVKGHSGEEGNERADQLANMGADSVKN